MSQAHDYCRWPLWADGEPPSHKYCNHLTAPGKVYCPMHSKIAFVQRSDQKPAIDPNYTPRPHPVFR